MADDRMQTPAQFGRFSRFKACGRGLAIQQESQSQSHADADAQHRWRLLCSRSFFPFPFCPACRASDIPPVRAQEMPGPRVWGGEREREGQPGCAFPIRFRRCACPLAKPSCNFRTRLLAKHLYFPSPEAAARKISHRHLLRHPAPSRACRMQEGTRDCSSPNPPCSNKANQSYGIEETTTHRQ